MIKVYQQQKKIILSYILFFTFARRDEWTYLHLFLIDEGNPRTIGVEPKLSWWILGIIPPPIELLIPNRNWLNNLIGLSIKEEVE